MNKTKIVNSLTRTVHKVGFQLKKHSPEIMVVAGTVGVVASTVMACKATTKVSTIVEEAKTQIDTIHSVVADPEMADKYTEEDSKKDLAIVYAQTGLKFVKLYGPSVALGVASLGCMIASNRILRKRNVALAAAYATVDRSFKDYRKNVVERFGDAMDKELKYNIKAQEVEETVVNEDGTETTVTKVIQTAQPSEHAKFFDELNPYWEKNAEYNLMFLRRQQDYANDKLQADGYLFLNDVYKMLGIEPTKAGQIVGWVYDKTGEFSDGYIDFGIYDLHNEDKRAFVNGYEKSILLDFNVDGDIWSLMN